jgi:hypothetical protein
MSNQAAAREEGENVGDIGRVHSFFAPLRMTTE